MRDRFGKVAALQTLLLGMERELGLDDLSAAQRKILYAAQLIQEEKTSAPLSEMITHPLLSGLSRATFYRALKSLIDDGYLMSFSSGSASHYKIAD